jgi:hypothetical protein
MLLGKNLNVTPIERTIAYNINPGITGSLEKNGTDIYLYLVKQRFEINVKRYV